MTTKFTKEKPVFFVVRIMIIVILLGIAYSAIYAGLGLFADGSNYLYMVLKLNGFWIFSKSRQCSQMITQIPVVLALKWGVKDINLLINLYSFGLIAIPLGFWMTALLLQIRRNFFWVLVLAFTVTYLDSGFFAIGEYNLTYAMMALCASIIFTKEIGLVSGFCLIVMAFALTRSYESTVFLGPLFLLILNFRIINDKQDSFILKLMLIVTAFLFIVACAVSVRSVMFPSNPAEYSSSLGLTLMAIESKSFEYLIIMMFLVLVSYLNNRSMMNKIILATSFLEVFIFLVKGDGFTPSMNFAFRIVSGVLLFSVFLMSALFYFYQKKNENQQDFLNKPTTIMIIFILFLSLTVPFIVNIYGYRDWASKFQSELRVHTGFIHIEKTSIYQDKGYKKFSWLWTNPLLSLFLRGNSDCVILNSKDNHWDPVDPKTINKNTFGVFEKSTEFYR